MFLYIGMCKNLHYVLQTMCEMFVNYYLFEEDLLVSTPSFWEITGLLANGSRTVVVPK